MLVEVFNAGLSKWWMYWVGHDLYFSEIDFLLWHIRHESNGKKAAEFFKGAANASKIWELCKGYRNCVSLTL